MQWIMTGYPSYASVGFWGYTRNFGVTAASQNVVSFVKNQELWKKFYLEYYIMRNFVIFKGHVILLGQ